LSCSSRLSEGDRTGVMSSQGYSARMAILVCRQTGRWNRRCADFAGRRAPAHRCREAEARVCRRRGVGSALLPVRRQAKTQRGAVVTEITTAPDRLKLGPTQGVIQKPERLPVAMAAWFKRPPLECPQKQGRIAETIRAFAFRHEEGEFSLDRVLRSATPGAPGGR